MMTIKRAVFGLVALTSLGAAVFLVVNNIQMKREGFPVSVGDYGEAVILVIGSAIMAGCAWLSGPQTKNGSPQPQPGRYR